MDMLPYTISVITDSDNNYIMTKEDFWIIVSVCVWPFVLMFLSFMDEPFWSLIEDKDYLSLVIKSIDVILAVGIPLWWIYLLFQYYQTLP